MFIFCSAVFHVHVADITGLISLFSDLCDSPDLACHKGPIIINQHTWRKILVSCLCWISISQPTVDTACHSLFLPDPSLAAFISFFLRLNGWHVSPALASVGMPVFLKIPHRIFLLCVFSGHSNSLLFPVTTERELENRLVCEATKIQCSSEDRQVITALMAVYS